MAHCISLCKNLWRGRCQERQYKNWQRFKLCFNTVPIPLFIYSSPIHYRYFHHTLWFVRGSSKLPVGAWAPRAPMGCVPMSCSLSIISRHWNTGTTFYRKKVHVKCLQQSLRVIIRNKSLSLERWVAVEFFKWRFSLLSSLNPCYLTLL